MYSKVTYVPGLLVGHRGLLARNTTRAEGVFRTPEGKNGDIFAKKRRKKYASTNTNGIIILPDRFNVSTAALRAPNRIPYGLCMWVYVLFPCCLPQNDRYSSHDGGPNSK